MFVLTADIAALRRSRLAPLIAARVNRLASDSANWAKLCDFDPLTAIDQIAFAIPSSRGEATEGEGSFGVIATGHFTAAQIERCATAAIAARNGDPVASKIGNFSSVRDRQSEGEIAARDDGTLILSDGRYLRALLDAAEGHAPRREHQDPRDAHHVELRRKIGSGTEVITWLLDDRWVEMIAGEEAGMSPLRHVAAVAERIELGSTARLFALLECTDAASAREIEALLQKLRGSLATIPLDPRLLALAQRVEVSVNDRNLRLELELSDAELEAILDLTESASPHPVPQIPAH